LLELPSNLQISLIFDFYMCVYVYIYSFDGIDGDMEAIGKQIEHLVISISSTDVGYTMI